MNTRQRRLQRIRALAISAGVALGVTLSTLGSHLAHAATVMHPPLRLPNLLWTDHIAPAVETDTTEPLTPAA